MARQPRALRASLQAVGTLRRVLELQIVDLLDVLKSDESSD